MQVTHIWNKLNLRRGKVILIVFLAVFFVFPSFGQGMFGLSSKSGSDDRTLSYGFFLAGHNASYRLKYSDSFVTNPNGSSPTVRAIFPQFSPGFSLGFTGILSLHDQIQLLFTPKVGFYEYSTEVSYFNTLDVNPPVNSPDQEANPIATSQLINSEATLIELPLLFKYRSIRFNNTRMYWVGGASYNFRTKSQEEANIEELVTTGKDFSLEMGMGFEIYFKYFKFAPEIRFSHGLNNIYQAENTNPLFRDAISSIKRKSITIYLNFQ
ncbi:MAG: outer membrane beta-barrel protein [Algoriphagus sp.]|uniref:type IX secretion/gliding motility protein PorT/SprT n=1 Tax=Algoriphagus sp. TaxID=1872435 RepID=UPI002624404B|nr:outer membrane beta-barrel protein [Algoriphagus sp.]MDG1279032.1 outer membrane beta-barrel protein [Algoriphagus sp.]